MRRPVIPYVDSSVRMKLYVLESNSQDAIRTVSHYSAVPATPLHELEMRNKFRVLFGRGVSSDAQRASSQHLFERDLLADRLKRTVPHWTEVYRISLSISSDYTAETLARSLDILHIAIAVSIDSKKFITSDRRQYEAARRVSMSAELIA